MTADELMASARDAATACAGFISASSSHHDDREGDVWRGLFLGGRRNFQETKRRQIDSGWLRGRNQGESDLRRCLHGRNRPRRSGGSRIRSIAGEIRGPAGYFLV